jgi:NADPH:quinone reductase
MRAIVIKKYGGPEALAIEQRPDPMPAPDQVLIEVKAFGLNHAEAYFRSGAWGDVAEITGIECVGLVKHDPGKQFRHGEKVAGIVGGMGRSINGSYAELVTVPRANVVAIKTELPWAELAAIPESYATAWTGLIGILSLSATQTVMVRGATSALGQAAVNIAAHAGARVIGTTRQVERAQLLHSLGAQQVLIDGPDLSKRVRESYAGGIDAVLDIIGNTTVLDSLAMLRRGGKVCEVGFLGGGGPLTMEPVFQIPSGRHFTTFASAVVTGTAEFPMSEIPLQDIVDRVAAGTYKAQPVRVFKFNEIREAHRIMESGQPTGKMVVVVDPM